MTKVVIISIYESVDPEDKPLDVEVEYILFKTLGSSPGLPTFCNCKHIANCAICLEIKNYSIFLVSYCTYSIIKIKLNRTLLILQEMWHLFILHIQDDINTDKLFDVYAS